MRKLMIIAAAVLAFGSVAANADSLQDGARYFQRADYNRALASWRPMAVQGNPVAQNNLGIMYLDGKGVPQNTSEAVRYLSLSAAAGLLGVEPVGGEIDGRFDLIRQHDFDGAEARLQAVAGFIERELAAIDDGHAICKALHLFNVMRGHKNRPTFLLGEFEEAADEFIAHQRIEPAEGFVEHDELRPIREAAEQRGLHSHAA